MRRILRQTVVICLGMAGISGCKPALPTEARSFPTMEGEWAYTADNLRIVGRPSAGECEISDLKLFLGPWRDTGFFGRTEGGRLICSDDLEPLSADLPSYPVRRGGSVLHFIAFDIGSPDWRHDGTIAGDTMSGIFWVQHPTFRMEGRFRAIMRHAGPKNSALVAGLLPALQ